MKITASAIRFVVAFVSFFVASFAMGAAGTVPAEPAATKAELIEIMKGVNFVPQLGKDDPFCKAFYDDFKTQTNIEHIQPIVQAESYDDPALRPYREKCPELDFRVSRWTGGKADLSHLPQDELDKLGTPTYGIAHLQLYNVDINNNRDDGLEIIFYYEGERTEARHTAPGSAVPMTTEIFAPEARAYRVINLTACRTPMAVHFNQGGSPRWTRNGVIRYQSKNGAYVLKSADDRSPNFRFLELWMYSEKLQRIVPTCAYALPRKGN